MTAPAPAVIADRYTRTAIALHWIVAALIAPNLFLIWFVDYLPEGWVRTAVNTHKSIGLTVFGLVMIRLLWRWTHRPPAFPADYPWYERAAAHLAHIALYALILLVPLTGYIHDSAWKDAPANPIRIFGLIPFPRINFIEAMQPAAKEALHAEYFGYHSVLSWALMGLFALHVAGALKHQWYDRKRELQRMGIGRDDAAVSQSSLSVPR